MGLHIILMGLLLLLAAGFFVFGLLSEQKIFLVGTFIILMLTGGLIQVEEGILFGEQVSGVDDNGNISYSDIIYSTEVAAVNMFAWLLVLVGGALTAWSAFAFLFSSPKSTSFHY